MTPAQFVGPAIEAALPFGWTTEPGEPLEDPAPGIGATSRPLDVVGNTSAVARDLQAMAGRR